jgi:hypothetical protein
MGFTKLSSIIQKIQDSITYLCFRIRRESSKVSIKIIKDSRKGSFRIRIERIPIKK